MENDREIIEKLLRKDPGAVNRMVELYAPGIYNVAFGYVQSREDAQEICSDVFMAALDAMHTFNRQSGLKTWLYRIAINKSLDFLKYRKRKKRFGIIFSIFDPREKVRVDELADFRHPGLELETKEMQDSLMEAINLLPEQQKVVVVQACFEKQSHREIAAILQTSEKAVESLLYRAKTNLKKFLEEKFENLYR